MKTTALVGEAASFCFVDYDFKYLKMKRLQQNKRYSETHDLVVAINLIGKRYFYNEGTPRKENFVYLSYENFNH